MKKPAKKPRRVVLGVGHPWFFGVKGCTFQAVKLLAEDGRGETLSLDPAGVGGYNRIRLVAEVLE